MLEGEPEAAPGSEARAGRDRTIVILIAGLSAALLLALVTAYFMARDASHDRESFKRQAAETNRKLDADKREAKALRDALAKAGVNPDTVVIPGPSGAQGPSGPAGSGGPVTPPSQQPPGPPGPTSSSSTSTTRPSTTTTTTRPPFVTLPSLPSPLRAR